MKITFFRALLLVSIFFGVATSANAATITIDIQEQDRQFGCCNTATDTVVDVSGEVDLTDLTRGSSAGFKFERLFWASRSQISLRNSTINGPHDRGYSFDVAGPSNIGLGGLSFSGAANVSGGTFHFSAVNGQGGLLLPDDYVSGATISTRAVLFNRSISSFGLSEGRYEYTFTNNSLVFNIGDPQSGGSGGVSQVPLPATGLLLLGAIFGGFGMSHRHKAKAKSLRIVQFEG